jgi:hypothetical protein
MRLAIRLAMHSARVTSLPHAPTTDTMRRRTTITSLRYGLTLLEWIRGSVTASSVFSLRCQKKKLFMSSMSAMLFSHSPVLSSLVRGMARRLCCVCVCRR